MDYYFHVPSIHENCKHVLLDLERQRVVWPKQVRLPAKLDADFWQRYADLLTWPLYKRQGVRFADGFLYLKLIPGAAERHDKHALGRCLFQIPAERQGLNRSRHSKRLGDLVERGRLEFVLLDFMDILLPHRDLYSLPFSERYRLVLSAQVPAMALRCPVETAFKVKDGSSVVWKHGGKRYAEAGGFCEAVVVVMTPPKTTETREHEHEAEVTRVEWRHHKPTHVVHCRLLLPDTATNHRRVHVPVRGAPPPPSLQPGMRVRVLCAPRQKCKLVV